jgi:hypothetical protein
MLKPVSVTVSTDECMAKLPVSSDIRTRTVYKLCQASTLCEYNRFIKTLLHMHSNSPINSEICVFISKITGILKALYVKKIEVL